MVRVIIAPMDRLKQGAKMRQITEAVQTEEELNFAIRPFVAKRLPYIVKRIGGGFALFDPNAKERAK